MKNTDIRGDCQSGSHLFGCQIVSVTLLISMENVCIVLNVFYILPGMIGNVLFIFLHLNKIRNYFYMLSGMIE